MRNCHSGSGRQRGALKAGEARTLLGMVAGVSPEPVEAFFLISLLKCKECGEPHRLVCDKDISAEAAIEILNSAMGLMVMARIREEAGFNDDGNYRDGNLW